MYNGDNEMNDTLYKTEREGNTVHLKNQLSRILGGKRMTICALSDRSGVSRTTLTKLYYNKEKALSYAVLTKVLAALGCELRDFFREEESEQCRKKQS